MRDDMVAPLARDPEHFGEFLRWMSDLGRVEPDRRDVSPVHPCVLERLQSFRDGTVAQERQDEAERDAEQLLAILESTHDTGDHGAEMDAARRMRLRVERGLDMTYVLSRRSHEVVPGEIVEVLFGHECGAAGVVKIQERLQIAEVIGGAGLLGGGVGEIDTVARREREHHLGLECSLKVQVELRFRQAQSEGIQVVRHVCLRRGGGTTVSSSLSPWRPEATCVALTPPTGSSGRIWCRTVCSPSRP